MASPNNKLLSKEIGKSGTNIASGVITGEDYNYRLSGKNAISAYEQMRRNDATVRAAMRAVKQPILSAKFAVDAASDKKSDVQIAEFVEHNLKQEVDWGKTLGEVLTYLEFGHSVFEKVFEPADVDGKRRIVLRKLAYRKQTTIEKWETEDGGTGIMQRLADGHAYSIPIERLVRFTNEQEGDNYEGISLLRTSYKNWKIKDSLYKIDAVGHEKHALGVLEITYPKGTSAPDIAKAHRAARNMRANEQSYVSHSEGIKFEFMDMKANTLRDIKPSIDHHDRQIMKNVLAQFLELGGTGGGSGSRAVSEDHSRLFELAVQAVADHVVTVIQTYVIKQLVDLNFTNVADYPQLRVGRISDDNVPVLSDAIDKFVKSGVLHPHPEDENTIRRMLGLAELSAKELATFYEPPATKDEKDSDGDNDDEPLKAARALHASLENKLYGPRQAA